MLYHRHHFIIIIIIIAYLILTTFIITLIINNTQQNNVDPCGVFNLVNLRLPAVLQTGVNWLFVRTQKRGYREFWPTLLPSFAVEVDC